MSGLFFTQKSLFDCIFKWEKCRSAKENPILSLYRIFDVGGSRYLMSITIDQNVITGHAIILRAATPKIIRLAATIATLLQKR